MKIAITQEGSVFNNRILENDFIVSSEPVFYIFIFKGFYFRVIPQQIESFSPGLPQRDYSPEKYYNPWTYWSSNEKLDSIRLQRDYLLQQTDWRAIRAYETQTPESQAWLDYRQALRDFPQTVS